MHLPSRTPLALAAAVCALVCSTLAQAQPVYRTVGPDGKVTFSDRAPSEKATPALAGSAGAAPVAATAAGGDLPYALRQTVSRFPVTLYTSADCAPCDSARSLLKSRGVPFTERTVNTNQDIDVLKSLSGNASLPFGTIGGQHLNGFLDTEWTQYLDAAGYPKKSQLPSNYRQPAATPLVAIKPLQAAPTAPAAPREAPPRPERPERTDSGTDPSNPAGIRF
ncbi:MAG: glutaredoxin family protein [Giesbergeria sp.]|nr:glutaredoxin family protein [Giesbergeria sp.]